MSTPSMLLLSAGAAASLAAVWTLAGFSESSRVRFTPRVVAATAVGLLGEATVYGRAPVDLRSDLSLPLLFAITSVVALSVGAAKLDAALSEKDGPRVIRRAAGIVAGTIFGMAAVGASSLDLSASSLGHARSGWALMFALVAATVVVFWQRARYAGVGLLLLGKRALILVAVGLALLAGARLTIAAPRAAHDVPVPVPVTRIVDVTPNGVAPVPSADDAAPAPSAATTPSAADSAPPVAVDGAGDIRIESISARGLLEADARGGIQRRHDRLQACLADPQNRQSGSLTLKIRIDAAGSVTYSRATGGDLMGTPLAACLMPVFYKMGFAAPSAEHAGFDITLRVP